MIKGKNWEEMPLWVEICCIAAQIKVDFALSGLILLFSDFDPIDDEKFSCICYIFRITQKEKVLIRSLHRALMLSNAARAARHAVSQK